MATKRKTLAGKSIEVLLCYHCANTVPLRRVGAYKGQQLFEHFDGQRFNEDFFYNLYQCPTCRGISVYGDFVKSPERKNFAARLIYPRGAHLLPEPHKVASLDCVPARIVKLYEEVWPLRHVAPNAFAGQIRRALEMICHEQKAQGKNLFQQLENLVALGTFPGYFAEITDLMRHVGNLGAHGGDEDVDFWDAELLDDFFRSVVEYVYIAPSKIQRLKKRIGVRTPSP
jgi:uncharacterized protein DUF4145